MISTVIFGLATGASCFQYFKASDRHRMVTSARDVKEGGSGLRYCSGVLGGTPVEFEGTPWTLETTSYDVMQRIETVQDSAFTVNRPVFKKRTFKYHPMVVNGYYITHLVPKLHREFARKLDETYEATAPTNLFNASVNLGSVRLNTQNEVLAGKLKKYHGVSYGPGTLYTVIGPYNGEEFYDETNSLIYKNAEIDRIRYVLENEKEGWKLAIVGCVISGLLCGAYELMQ